MSVASVSGRLRAERLASDPGSVERIKAAKAARRKVARDAMPKPLHQQYRDAWKKAGKPVDFPSMAEWLQR